MPSKLATILATSTLTFGTAVVSVSQAHAADTAPAPVRFITDDQGRALILHGLNTANSSKGSSGLPWIGQEDVARERRDLGTNSVRYLIQWNKIEPKPGVYDEAYLDAVAERVRWYHEQGMQVVLDMHQDLYGHASCNGNGAPEWATHTDGQTCTPQEQWFLNYLQPAVLNAFDNFWNYRGTHPELMRHYTAMFKHVAERFADVPGVLGYDLMNEPYGGSRHLLGFERSVLTPFYQRLINAIRQVDSHSWIFVEPTAIFSNGGVPTDLGPLQDPRTGTPRLVFAPHLYPAATFFGLPYNGFVKLVTQANMALWQSTMGEAAKRLGMPLWAGEFGNVGSADAAFISDSTDVLDQMTAGWAYWSNDPGPTGPYNNGAWTSVGTHLARPYPRAIAGVPTKIKATSSSLTLVWNERAGVTGPTEIWLPGWTFPSKPTVKLSDGAYRWDPDTRLLQVHAGTRSVHSITVTP